ncbi:Tripeptidyl-peptidase I [Purpureocillium takamizusanense]|uniref:tripeptidyl-peptidase II n=1 Tax=Purpureocillium takamizusanense TaxID=2060973 RepID=A0A9Q8VDI3_9HYPO|nr:Tripeptidyl-peptidase I [Purpureocillium takamizusanense]UNI20929.1 Tripeptidyl-peptidase I [Purpureocillium takamizusanense]
MRLLEVLSAVLSSDVVISLRPADRDLLDSTLAALSDPDGESYGKFLTREQAQALLRPHQSSIDAVKKWLAEVGVPEEHIRGDGGQVIEARVPTLHAERLLRLAARGGQTEDEERRPGREERDPTTALRAHVAFVHRAPGPRSTGTDTPRKGFHIPTTVPRPLQAVVQAPARKGSTTPSCSGGVVTPTCLRALYRMGSGNSNNSASPAHARSRFGVVGFRGQAAQHAQLNKFLAALAPDARGANFSTVLVNGGSNPQDETYTRTGEANLDIQYAVAMAYPVPVTFYAVGGEDHDFVPDLDIWDRETQFIEPYATFFSHLLGLDDEHLPQVVTISYGVNEQDVPRAHAEHICDMMGQLGARGVSVITSSGDEGPGVSCLSNDGTNTTKFLPAFPASCPYVTAVGGTHGQGPEGAWNLSSGGFSEYWPRPAWQELAVDGYLVRLGGSKWKGLYNPKGRAFPDVSAQAMGYQIFDQGKADSADGTSAAAPVFAAMIALLNDSRLKLGLPPLGFLNPWLYKIGSLGFSDIVNGASKGCVGTSYSGRPAPVVPGAEWAASPGWDPATGLGTPLFDRLKVLALALR